VARAFSFHVLVVAGINEAPVLRRPGEWWPELPSQLEAMRNYTVGSSIVAHCGVEAPL
jgi:hypothetical protein